MNEVTISKTADGLFRARIKGFSISGFGESEKMAVADLRHWVKFGAHLKWNDNYIIHYAPDASLDSLSALVRGLNLEAENKAL